MNGIARVLGKLYTEKDHRIVLFSVLAAISVFISLTFFILSIGRPYLGIRLLFNNQDWRVEITDSNGLAHLSGINSGDRPVVINGQPAEIFLKQYEQAGAVFGRLVNELTVVNEKGQIRTVMLRDASVTWQSTTNQLAELIVCLTFWIVAFFAFYKRPKIEASLLLAITSLSVGLALSANLASELAVPTALWFELIATAISPWLLLHFFLVLPEERKWFHNNHYIYLIYVPVAITLVLLPIIGYADRQPVPWFRSIRLFGYGVGFLASVVTALFNYVHTSSTKTRQQMKIVLIGCLAALIPFLVLSVLPEAIFRRTIIPSGLSILFVSFIPLGMGYAIVTRKLLDIDVFVRRSITHGLITIVMAAILLTGILITTFQRTLGVFEEVIIAFALAAVATALFGPVKAGVEKLVDKYIYKDRYDYRLIINGLSTSLISIKELVEMSRLIVGTSVQALNLTGGCLFVRTQSDSWDIGAAQGTLTDPAKQKQLSTLVCQRNSLIEFPNSASNACDCLAYLIPLFALEKEVGVFCLSPKASRQPFSNNDIYLLQGVASVSAIALRNAMLVRDVSVRDTFVSVASHELRTPLTSIVGYADLLLRRDPPVETRQRWLKNILYSGQRITDMVDDLLNVARIQSGRLNIKLEKVGISDLLGETLPVIEESTDKHEFMVDVEPDLPGVLVDRNKFSQVIGNLLSNAVKYSPKGGRITVRAKNNPEQNRVVVSVSDEGIGIDTDDQASLFTTFHRVQRPETQGIRGSGLGLYIAKEWTEAMGGEIRLESQIDLGTTFFVSVPSCTADVGVNPV